MLLSEFSGKEIIDVSDGSRLGIIDECELVLDIGTGGITGVILPRRRNFFDFRNSAQNIIIPWQTIKRIGDDIIIVDLSAENPRTGGVRRYF